MIQNTTLTSLAAAGWTRTIQSWPQVWQRGFDYGIRVPGGIFFEVGAVTEDAVAVMRLGLQAFQGEIDYTNSPVGQRQPGQENEQ